MVYISMVAHRAVDKISIYIARRAVPLLLMSLLSGLFQCQIRP